jgi:hypothetical protein
MKPNKFIVKCKNELCYRNRHNRGRYCQICQRAYKHGYTRGYNNRNKRINDIDCDDPIHKKIVNNLKI